MKIGKLDISIKEYIGRIGPGILVSLSVLYGEEIYEAMYWYTNTEDIIEINEDLFNKIGEIEKHKDYDDIIKFLQEKRVDYSKATEFDDIFEN